MASCAFEESDQLLALLLSLGLPEAAAAGYVPALLSEGFDSSEALEMLTAEDLLRLGFKEGHSRLLLRSKATAAPEAATGGQKSKAKSDPKPKPSAAIPKPSGSGLPLDGLTVCMSGSLSTVRRELQRNLRAQGAQITNSVTRACTHLITTQCEADSPTRKVLSAMSLGTPIVSEGFVNACLAAGSLVPDDEYRLTDSSGAASAWPAGSRSGRGGTGARSSAASEPSEAAIVAGARRTAPVSISSDRASEDAARQVMLAQKWESRLDPTGWWMSEKLDGVRGYWDGKNFYSRLGNQFPAPEWFKAGLPSTPLDGELWCGRRQFRRCLSIVRNRSSGKLWEYITFLVFDAPSLKEPYEQRVAFIKRTLSQGCPHAAAVGVVKCTGREHLDRELKLVDSKGGEGIMLREAGSAYENKRSKVLRKVKSVHDEEAKIVGHEGGRGARGFHCGALTLETPDGRRFSCGSGLSAADRQDPPAIGTVVTYRFTELMDNGYPRFPVYVGPRIDLDWAAYCASYQGPKPEDHAPGGLRKTHSILYSDAALEQSLSDRVAALPAPTADEPVASEGSEAGETEAEDEAGKEPKRKRAPSTNRREVAAKAAAAAETRSRLWRGASFRGSASASSSKGSASACSGSALQRSRSETLAEESGLDLETARGLLQEHDRSAFGQAARGP